MSAQAKLRTVVTHLSAYWKRSKALSPRRKGVGWGLHLGVESCCWLLRLPFKSRDPRISSRVPVPSFCLTADWFCAEHCAPRCPLTGKDLIVEPPSSGTCVGARHLHPCSPVSASGCPVWVGGLERMAVSSFCMPSGQDPVSSS
jgi:hypothetical protein